MTAFTVQAHDIHLEDEIRKHIRDRLGSERAGIDKEIKRVLKKPRYTDRVSSTGCLSIVFRDLGRTDIARSTLVCRAWKIETSCPMIWRRLLVTDQDVTLHKRMAFIDMRSASLAHSFYRSQYSQDQAVGIRMEQFETEKQFGTALRYFFYCAAIPASIATIKWVDAAITPPTDFYPT